MLPAQKRTLAFALLGVLLGGRVAHALELPTLEQLRRMGSVAYADELERMALERNGLVAEPEPEGKTLERLVVVPYDVIIPEDPWPTFPALIHPITRPDVVEREVLLEVGQPWRNLRARETERNLRANLMVNIARVVPCKGAAPDQVVGLVITKDMWSLRPGIDFLLVGNQLQYLELFVAEHNLFGRRKSVGLDFAYDPRTLMLGQRVRDPRVWGSRIAITERGDVIWNQQSGALEGGIAQLSVEHPIYSLSTPWGWLVSADYMKNVFRQYQSGTILPITSSAGENMLLQYRQERLDLRALLTRAWGERFRFELSGGWRGNIKAFSFYNSDGTAFSQASLDYFSGNYLPRTESMGMLTLQGRLFQAEFVQLFDFERFALPEDYRLGPDVRLEQRLGLPAFGWSQYFYEPDLNIDWNVYAGDNLFQGWLRARARYQPGLVADSAWVNQIYSLRVRNISPRLGFLRIAASARLVRRFWDLDHALDTLGGNNGIRGFPSDYLYGQQLWGGNLELRTVPFKVWAMYLGAVAFADGGNVFGTVDRPGFSASLGFGLRIGIPQFNRSLLRLDFAFPVTGAPLNPAYFVATFGQAF